MFDGGHPNIKLVGNQLRHVVTSGNTLTNIAKHYSETDGFRLSWQDVYNVNKDIIGSNPNVIKPGQALRIPGITTASPKHTNRSISEMDGDRLMTRTARVQHETGEVSTIDIVALHANGSHAEQIGNNANDAVLAAKKALSSDAPRSWQYAVTQANDGAYWIVPLNGREISDNLDHTDTTLSLAYRADDREVSAIVTKDYQGTIGVRRYDI
jgi:LysM repeat protein